jgi:hypothetical protein
MGCGVVGWVIDPAYVLMIERSESDAPIDFEK